MTLNELKAAILENGTGIYFEFNGKKCGVEPEVQDSVFTFTMWYGDRKSTRLNSSHSGQSRMPSSA